MAEKKRKVLSIEEKGAIIARIENGETNAALAEEFQLSHSSVTTIWKNREKIKAAFNSNLLKNKKLRQSTHNDIEKALLQWFTDKRSRGIPISGPLLQKKAEEFGKALGKEDYKCSESWIKRFRARNNIVPGKISGESGSVDVEVTDQWIKTVWPNVRKNYEDEEIFNADETGLFFKLTPQTTLKFKGEKCSGGKLSKDRVTVLVAANMTGTIKQKLLVIGKSKNPRCFKNVKRLPVTYQSNNKAWMTSEIFTKFLQDWDKELTKSRKKILLLIDNCAAHPNVQNLVSIELCFLPPNTTSVLQPLDQGIIKSIKTYFRKFLVMKMIENDNNDCKMNINLLEAINLVSKAWDRVTAETIKNCFKHAGFTSKNLEEPLETESYDEEDDLPLMEWLQVVVKSTEKIISHEEFLDFVRVDENVETCGELTDEDILQTIQIPPPEEEEETVDGESESDFTPPNVLQAMQALSVVRNFIAFNNSVSEDLLQHVRKLELEFEQSMLKNKKQSKITDYILNN